MKKEMKQKRIPHEFDYYVLLFFTLAFIGWVWEVALFLVTDHAFINRGIYRGPYLPIYGAGGLLLCFLLHSYRRRPLLVFGLSMLLCTGLEYLTSWLLEQRWGIRWWDYSGHFLNINGRVCLLGAMVFGLGGTALICLLLPAYEKGYRRIPPKLRMALCLILLLVFAADAAYCAMRPNVGRGITFPEAAGLVFTPAISGRTSQYFYL
ncbi:MAG: putative ABC transporter permease [Acetatifactor sp.]|nr:putative ABC transporter permease [Acetatifactor sp.]